MKILQISAAYKPAYIYGGPTMSVSKLSEQLVNAGHKVDVFTTTANGPNELPVATDKPLVIDGVPVTYFKRITKDHSHFSPSLLNAVWKNARKYDVVHIHAWWNLVSVLSCLIALKRKVPVIISPRGTLSNYSFHNRNAFFKKSIHRSLGKNLLQKCRIHVTTTREAEAIAGLIKPEAIINIPNFVELPVFQPIIVNALTPTLKLLFFSRIEEKKGLDILLNALKTVNVPYHLTIAGDGETAYIDQLKILAANNGVSDKVTWAGFFDADKFRLLGLHDLLVLPSHDESFGNVVVESLSTGTAVLISDKVGLAGYVADKQLGWICNTNAQSVSNAINNISNKHRKDLLTIKEIAPAIVRRDFTGITLVQQYINMYKNITSNDRIPGLRIS